MSEVAEVDATAEAGLPQWPFPRPEANPVNPPDWGMQALESGEIQKIQTWDGVPVWAVTRYEDVRKGLANKNLSSNLSRPGFPTTSAAQAATRGGRESLTRSDPPKHTNNRKILTKDFMPVNVEKLRPQIELIVDQLIDELAERDGQVDLVESYGKRLPTTVTLGLLGLPLEDGPFIDALVSRTLSQTIDPAEARQAAMEQLEYFSKKIDEEDESPTSGLVGRIVADHYRTGDISKEDLQHLLILLVAAGFDTTANAITLGVALLLEHPEQLAWVLEDPERWPGAVEELLRYTSVNLAVHFRQALADVEIGGETIKEGSGIVLWANVANRDSSVYENPNTLDLSRNARNHLAFGFGIHQCLGQGLARLELQIAFKKLFDAFPEMRLAAPFSDIKYNTGLIFGPAALPMEMGPRA